MGKLFINIEHIASFTGFDGNIDNDTINPFIFMAQNSEIKRILGDDLYNKMNTDFKNDVPFVSQYLEIYNVYILPIHSYFSASFYLKLGVPKVSQNGVYLVTPEKTEQIFDEKTNKMANMYEKLAIDLELKLLSYLNSITIPEWVNQTQKAKSSFNWIKI